MSNKSVALSQQPRQMREGQTLSHSCAGRRQRGAKPLQALPFRLTANQHQTKRSKVYESLQKLRPTRLRPVFALATTAGMQCQTCRASSLRHRR